MAGIFKAYDIRGVVGRDLTADIALKIGQAFAAFLKCRTVVVGRDMRPHSEPLGAALIEGLTRQGARVIRLGLCSTPMCYHAVGRLEADAGIMITASHNPGEWNGFKLCRAQAVPISGATGIREIEALVAQGVAVPAADASVGCSDYEILPDYRTHLQSLIRLKRPVRIAADFANAMGILEVQALAGAVDVEPLFDTFDGTFPNHEANPLKTETLAVLQETVRNGNYDFGVALDGDADRVGFTDEKGAIIPMDMITALIARSVLKRRPGPILYDLRSSRAVKEEIEAGGGRAIRCRVGHAFIKQHMRDVDAAFAGELSGHYYFRDNYFTESAALAILYVAQIIAESDRPLSDQIQPLQRYHKSPEINSEVKDVAAVFKRLKDEYAAGRIFELDGLSVEFDDWWFNVRASNTEPLVRLNLEASEAELLSRHQAELLRLIRA